MATARAREPVAAPSEGAAVARWRRLALLLSALSACDAAGDVEAVVLYDDAGADRVPAGDRVTPMDGGQAAAAVRPAASDVATPLDAAPLPDARPADLGRDAPVGEVAPPPDVPLTCRGPCQGLECGRIPDGCGRTLDCGDCEHPEETCIRYDAPRFIGAVRSAIAACKREHPEWFDLADSAGGDSVRVLDLARYRADVVQRLVASGLRAIADPNDVHEIRVRDATDAAENYRVQTSAGYTLYRYTSTCSPSYY